SAGTVDADVLRCGYHGIEFDATGSATRIPGQERIPQGCAVESYPVAEQDAMIWIWMGDPALADTSEIPAYPWHSSPEWRWKSAVYRLACNYQLLNDNLLDLSHLGF